MYHFIANPNARSGQGLALWEKIKLKLIAEHIDYQIQSFHGIGWKGKSPAKIIARADRNVTEGNQA